MSKTSKIVKQVRAGKYFITQYAGCKLVCLSRPPLPTDKYLNGKPLLTDGQGNIPVHDEFKGFWSATNYANKLLLAEELCDLHHKLGWNSMTMGMIMSSMTPSMMRKEIKQATNALPV